MEYFDKKACCRDDAVNSSIWCHSSVAQTSIPHTAGLVEEGSIGAQQAMMCAGIAPEISFDTILPWVPDLLGQHWKSSDALLVVGTAYAGFIREFSGRSCCMDLSEYASLAKGEWPGFQDHFIDHVVAGDSNYYSHVVDLVTDLADFAHLALFDVCRASFVKRGRGRMLRVDSSSQASIKTEPELFSDYAEWEGSLADGTQFGPGAWTWSRITESSASCIIALGHVAEHGLLRHFMNKLEDPLISLRTRHDTKPRITLDNKKWPNAYANREQKLGSWVPAIDVFEPEDVEWWCVSGKVNGTSRRWCVFPTYHPAQAPDAVYLRRVKTRLKVMWESRNT